MSYTPSYSNFQPMVNNQVYSWSTLTITTDLLPGQILNGIKSINYGYSKTKTNVFAGGANVYGRAYGKKEPNLTITMTLEQARIFQNTISSRDLTDIPPFKLTVTMMSKNAAKITNDTLYDVEFISAPIQTGSDDDGGIDVECEMIVGAIKYNAADDAIWDKLK
jgi:hypothetical protein